MSQNDGLMNRRSFFLASSAAFALCPYRLVAQDANVTCGAIDQMIINAANAKQAAGGWAVTTAPGRAQDLLAEIAKLEATYADTSVLADRAQLNAYLATLNAVVAIGFTFAAGGIATGPLLVASVATAGVFMVADALTAVQAPEAMEVATDVGINRVGVVLSAAGDDAYALSTEAATLSQGAAKVVGSVGIVLAAYTARKKLDTATALADEEIALKAELDNLKQLAQDMQDKDFAEEVRAKCMEALEGGLIGARTTQNPQCLN